MLLLLRLQAPQLGVHVHQVDAGGVVDVERRFHQLVSARGCSLRRSSWLR